MGYDQDNLVFIIDLIVTPESSYNTTQVEYQYIIPDLGYPFKVFAYIENEEPSTNESPLITDLTLLPSYPIYTNDTLTAIWGYYDSNNDPQSSSTFTWLRNGSQILTDTTSSASQRNTSLSSGNFSHFDNITFVLVACASAQQPGS